MNRSIKNMLNRAISNISKNSGRNFTWKFFRADCRKKFFAEKPSRRLQEDISHGKTFSQIAGRYFSRKFCPANFTPYTAI
jgi:hypothetical protein